MAARSTPTAPRAHVGVLGPVVVVVDGVERSVSARRPRALLACLAMRAGTPVSADRLLEEVWGDRLPETGVRAVAYQIARLRSLLEPDRTGEGTLITTTPAGYLLHIDPDDIDAHHAEHLVDQARTLSTSDPEQCEDLLIDALALWRGPPFADLADEPFVADATRHLDLLHLTARRTLAETRITLGRASEAITDLEALVADDPLDEALTGLLMTALHHTGRTADALHTYDQLRRRLATELGIDPSHHLQHLEHQLLGANGQPTRNGRRARPVPTAASSFVGRTTELTTLADWLATARLVTVCGFGGLGKTRLAQQLAHTIADRFTDGVWYVDLAPITDPRVLVDTIITVGGLTIPPGVDRHERLLAHLAGSELLVVLDNCEHLADDLAELTTQILHHAPSVHVLATSRIPLGIPGEALFTLHPLDTPSAHELLTDRANFARPGFTIDTTNRDAAERLTARLDGIPLAIELAAARLTVLTLDQLVDHLDQPDLLTNGRPHPDPRQQSMTAVIDWSYHLLDPTDQQLLRRLTVCAGGFDLDAATAIGLCDPPAANTDVLDHLDHLVHAALIEFDTTHHDPPRYRILEPIRQHTTTKLTPDERDHAASAHATHYQSVAATIDELWSESFERGTRLAWRELDNLRAAMSWAYRHDHPELGLSIARDIRSHFIPQAMHRELLRWLSTGLDLIVDDDPLTLEAACAAIHAASCLGQFDALAVWADRVERGLDRVVDPRLRAELLSASGEALEETDPRMTQARLRSAIELRAHLAPHRSLALLFNLVAESWLTGTVDDAEALLQRLAEIEAKMPEPDEAMASMLGATIAARAGRWQEVLRIVDAAGATYPFLEPWMWLVRAEAVGALGRFDDATAALEQLDAARDTVIPPLDSLVLSSVELRRGNPRQAARRLMTLSDEIARDDRRLAIAVQVAPLLAIAACDLGQHETAAVLFGHAEAEQHRLDIVLRASDRPLVEHAIATCRTALGADRYDELAARGAATAWRDLPRVEPDVA